MLSLDLKEVQNVTRAALLTPMGNTFSADPQQQQWGLPIMWVSDPGASKTSVMRQLVYHMRWGPSRDRRVPFLSYEPGAIGEAGFGVTPVPVEVATNPAFNSASALAAALDTKSQIAIDFPPPAELVRKFPGNTPGMLFLDEASTARGQQLDALLTCLQYGRLGTYQLNPRVRRMGAMNPSDQTSGGELIPIAVANRVCWINYPDPTVEQFGAYLTRGARLLEPEAHEILDLDTMEARVLAAWPALWPQAVSNVWGFLSRFPDHQRQTPDLTKDSSAKPWPSPRSWEYVTRALAISSFMGLTDSERDALVYGLVGTSSGSAWFTWNKDTDLPVIDKFLSGEEPFEHQFDRMDRTAALLAGCRARLRQKDLPGRAEKARQFCQFMITLADSAADLLAPSIEDLYEQRLLGSPEGATLITKITSITGNSLGPVF